MTIWLVFSSIMIALVCGALIREGFGAPLAAKVAGWSMLTALIGTQVPTVFPWLDGRDHSNPVRQTPDWTVFDKAISNPIAVHTTRELLAARADASNSKTASNDDPDAKIDFMPICGGGEKGTENRLDLAKLNEVPSDKRC